MSRSLHLGKRTEEQFRRLASRSTEQIARRFGDHFPMYVGCGFPKSGTVWLCRLMASYLGVPYPQNYSMPIAMSAVVHAHWDYHPSLPKTGYIYRDGRDVMVSLYNHHMRQMSTNRHPRSAGKLREHYARLYGPSFDPTAVRANMARFIEAEFTEPAYGLTWPAHIHDWLGEPHPQVSKVGYEALKADTAAALSELMADLLDRPADPRLVELAVARHDFELNSGRAAGAEDASNPLRKGIVGDWRNVFTREAGEVFEQVGGRELRLLGYETDAAWPRTLDD